MRIYLVRHGQTEWNREKRIQGSIDQPLNLRGEMQAHRLGRQLKEIPFDQIYSSPLSRARQTAEILTQHFPGKIELDPILRENHFGAAEGMTREEYFQSFATQIAEVEAIPFPQRAHHKVVPDAESLAEVATRVLPFLHRVVQEGKGKNLLAVTHGGVIRALLIALFEIEYDVENTGYVMIEYTDGQFLLQEKQGLVARGG